MRSCRTGCAFLASARIDVRSNRPKEWAPPPELINQLVRLSGSFIGCKFPLQLNLPASFQFVKIAPENRRHDFETNSALLRARQSGVRQHGFIWEVECYVDCAGGRSHLKPLQQWNVLGMVDKVEPFFLYLNGRRCVRQHLNGVALFQVVLESNSANQTAR